MPLPIAQGDTNVAVSVATDATATTLLFPPLMRWHPGGQPTTITRLAVLGTIPTGWTAPPGVEVFPLDAGGHAFIPMLSAAIGMPPTEWRCNALHGLHITPLVIPTDPVDIHASGDWRESGLGVVVFNPRTGATYTNSLFAAVTLTAFVSLEKVPSAS